MLDPSLSHFAVAAVILLIFFLSYVSQYFLPVLEHGTPNFYLFNALLASIWTTYILCLTTAPGSPPPTWSPSSPASLDAEEGQARPEARRLIYAGGKWCKKCERWKPGRAHHCKTCKTCVLRMDHHCPWTANCIGYRNLPHFLRFVGISWVGCTILFFMLFSLAFEIWEARNLPSTQSPLSSAQIALLGITMLVDFVAGFALFVLWVRSVIQISEGFTTIETWEKERHDVLVRRKVVRRVVFPYDVGLWENFCCALGYDFTLLGWFWPFARSPVVGEVVELGNGEKIRAGLEWEVNGFEDPKTGWPPEDPEKYGRGAGTTYMSPEDKAVEGVGDVEAFRRRQQVDLKRWEKKPGAAASGVDVRRAFEEMKGENVDKHDSGYGDGEVGDDGMWRNEDGETLADLGVDDEDIPLAELMRRRNIAR